MLDKEKVGKRIAYYRKERGLTQKELAGLLNISYQAVSKWEAGNSFPTVEMLYEIANILNVTVDLLLNEKLWDNRWISYRDTGLDTTKLYALKDEILKLNTKDERLLYSDYADACLFQMDTAQNGDSVYSFVTCVPGSKERVAREHRYNQEICADVAASAMNFTVQHGLKPIILKAMIVCGNYDQEQLYLMAQAFQRTCEQNGVMFAGMEIAAQPVNYNVDEYVLSATVVGTQRKENLLDRRTIKAGDVIIGIQTEGIDGTNYPFVKVMLDRKPGLLYAKIDEEKYFLEELLKPGTAFTREVMALIDKGYVRGAFRVSNSLLKQCLWGDLQDGLLAVIDMVNIPMTPLYRFLHDQDMIGEKVFPYHFHLGIGMIVVVPEEKCEEAMTVIRQYSECCRIGQIETDTEHKGEKVWMKGQIAW